MLLGAKNLSGSVDVRLPITRGILKKMIAAVSSVVESFHLQVAVKAKFSLAFFALLRPGEITTKSQKVKNDKGILQFPDVLIKKDKGVKMVYITIHRALCTACSNKTQTARVYHNASSSPSKHEDLTRCCFNVGPAPLAVGQ